MNIKYNIKSKNTKNQYELIESYLNSKLDSMYSHIDNLYKILDIDMTYEKWVNMSLLEQKQFERDLKLKKILNGKGDS